MTTRNVQAYEAQVSKVFGKVKVASRHAWLAGLGAISRVQTSVPRVYAELVREGAQYEGRARRNAQRALDAVKSSRGFETVEKTARTYQRKLRKAYAETAAAVRPQASAVKAKPAAAKRAAKRVVRKSARRVERAAA
jgi:poly(hydroxyalkanoate) granule-associated protein